MRVDTEMNLIISNSASYSEQSHYRPLAYTPCSLTF